MSQCLHGLRRWTIAPFSLLGRDAFVASYVGSPLVVLHYSKQESRYSGKRLLVLARNCEDWENLRLEKRLQAKMEVLNPFMGIEDLHSVSEFLGGEISSNSQLESSIIRLAVMRIELYEILY